MYKYSKVNAITASRRADLPDHIRKAYYVLRALMDRKGFEEWFEPCDEETKDEILQCIADELEP